MLLFEIGEYSAAPLKLMEMRFGAALFGGGASGSIRGRSNSVERSARRAPTRTATTRGR
jgi:hypothetical protein